MQAANDRIHVQKGIIPERTQGGILIAAGTSADAKVKLNIGRVLSVGKGIRFSNGDFIKPDCQPGDVVMWEQFGEINAEILGEGKVSIRWEDVIGILEPEEYRDWFFNIGDYKAYQEKLDKELSDEKQKIKEREEKAASESFVFACKNKDCYRGFGKPVTTNKSEPPQCDFCGTDLGQVEERVAPSIVVKGGASPNRV